MDLIHLNIINRMPMQANVTSADATTISRDRCSALKAILYYLFLNGQFPQVVQPRRVAIITRQSSKQVK